VVNDALILLATAVFAVTGVLAAARQNMDVLSFVIIGIVTAVGGGTLRDITLDRPVFWLHDPTFLYVAAGAAAATFFFEQRFRSTYNALLYFDAIGTAVFTVLAAERTIGYGFPPAVALVMGVITGIGGGLIRDLLTGQPTILTRRELYMTPILIGLVVYGFGLQSGRFQAGTLSLLAMLVIAAIRMGAIRWSWGFPDWLTYKPLKPS
jgi:uncharacterized membrane protein YeiH